MLTSQIDFSCSSIINQQQLVMLHAQFAESNLLDDLIRFRKNSLIQQFPLSNLATDKKKKSIFEIPRILWKALQTRFHFPAKGRKTFLPFFCSSFIILNISSSIISLSSDWINPKMLEMNGRSKCCINPFEKSSVFFFPFFHPCLTRQEKLIKELICQNMADSNLQIFRNHSIENYVPCEG